jgi:RNA polymerase sigma factor (sigma-70 family)
MLEEKYVRRRLMSKLGIFNPDDMKLMEIVDFVIDRLERNGLERLMKFSEKCKFKTFLSTVVSNLLYDYWREKYGDEKQETKYQSDFRDFFDAPVEDPVDVLIKSDEEAVKNKASGILRRLLERMDFKEKLAIELKYDRGLKLSEIARTLGETRYKVEQFIKDIEYSLKSEIQKSLALAGPGGNYETPGR